MRYLSKLFCCLACAFCLGPGTAHAQLDITMDYTGFLTGPSGNANTILNGASYSDAIAVMDHAAAIWEDVFADSSSGLSWATGGVVTQTISVGWADHSGSTLARGGTGWWIPSGEFTSGWINWDGDNSSSFFVDTTPEESTEWQQYSERSMSLGGVSVNIERVSYDASSSSVYSYSDMLTVALHEMAHAIGFLSTHPLYSAADAGGDSDIDITSGAFSGADIPIIPTDRSHTNVSIGSPGNDAKGPGRSDFPYDPGTNSWFPNLDYNPTVMSPLLWNGVRYGLTEADILVVAEYLDFDMATVNFAPDPFAVVLGDMDGDGSLTSADIPAFVQALVDEAGYASAYPSIDPNLRGDFSGDLTLTNRDIYGFVNALSSAGALTQEELTGFATLLSEAGISITVPEPTAFAMLGVAGAALLRRRR